MSEKGDLPQDTDSLPPNYASSEVFTDSPPPAYKKTSTVRLQVTRVICFTILAAGFLTGVFILTHTWISNKAACDCQTAPNSPLPETAFLQASSLPQVESLVAEQDGEKEANENELDSSQLDQESRLMDIPLPFEEDVYPEEDPLEIAEEALEEEEQQLQDLVEEVQNKAKFPLDMILGNPQMAGKEVQCKVEKKMQNLGGGILSKTIIVTCDDDNDDGDNQDEEPINSPFGGLLTSRPVPAPPMSILAPILKMMAARATARLQRQMHPKPSFRAFPQPFMQPVGMPMNGPFSQQPFPAPFPFEGPSSHFEPHSHGDGPAHFHHHSGPMNHEMGLGPVQGPFPMPGNSISESHMDSRPMHFMPHRHEPPQHMREHEGPVHGSFVPFEGERDAPFREDFMNNRPPFPEPTAEPTLRILPSQNMEVQEQQEENNSPPIKIFHGFPPQMPEALKQIVSRIMNRPENRELADRQPIIKIKAIPEQGNEANENMPKSKLLLPLPLRAVKFQSRGARKLESNEDGNEGSIFPIPRGAFSSGMKPHIVPEAAGRALDSPVALPSLSELPPLRFFPGKLLRIPVPIQGRAITHMEMKQNPNVVPIEHKPTIEDQVEQQEVPNVPETEQEEVPDFGPPRRHTVIRAPALLQDNIQEESNLTPPFLRRFPPPPPPKFAREGRVGLIPENNPEAELVNPVVAEAKAHHMIMVN